MEVILLQRVENLGNLGDKVAVKAGYGRNYLIPTGRAVAATPANLADFEARRAELEKAAGDALTHAQARAAELEQLSVVIARKAGEEGRLFGSVGSMDIVKAVSDAGLKLDKQEVRLAQGPFRVTGEYEVELRLHSDVSVALKLEIVPE
jgi:large subunit ribosomal protein L9